MKYSMQCMEYLIPKTGRVTLTNKGESSLAATGQSEETLKLFDGIYKSKQFTMAAAYEAFGNIKRSK
jgi:hypothetical protein